MVHVFKHYDSECLVITLKANNQQLLSAVVRVFTHHDSECLVITLKANNQQLLHRRHHYSLPMTKAQLLQPITTKLYFRRYSPTILVVSDFRLDFKTSHSWTMYAGFPFALGPHIK